MTTLSKKKLVVQVDEDDPSVSHVPEARCPVCDAKLDAASAVQGASQPGPGDVSVCFYCTAFLQFNDNMELKLLKFKDLKEMEPETVAELEHVREMIKGRDRQMH